MPLQATSGAASYDAFGGGVPVVPNYIEDVFSTYLYTGNGSTQTITNGIDLAGNGGLVWTKIRTVAQGHPLTDTVRGSNKISFSNLAGTQFTQSDTITSFNSTGYTLGADSGNFGFNATVNPHVSWTFRKQPKFFDVVTYTGTGSNQTIAHSLGSVPGSIFVKRTNAIGAWQVYHRSLANTEYLVLNTTAAKATGATRWNSTTPTSTVFSLGTDATVNASGGTYVAYIFAHDAGGFGLTGTDNVISCGSFTTDGSGNASVNLGYEPQFWLYKPTIAARNWTIYDTMRGWSQTGIQNLTPNLTDAEGGGAATLFYPTATGFDCVGGALDASTEHIYIAIRRGPMKVPTSGTSVFNTVVRAGTGTATSVTGAGFPPDFMLSHSTNVSSNNVAANDRLRGASQTVNTNTSGAEFTSSVLLSLDQNGFSVSSVASGPYNSSGETNVNWLFRRAPGFFDEVCYTGDGNTTGQIVTHNLGVFPQLIILKSRSTTTNWPVNYSVDSSFSTATTLGLNLTSGNLPSGLGGQVFGLSATTFYAYKLFNDITACNEAGTKYVAYLFATCAGVSKVGHYTGTGTTLQVNCGFTGGARFVMIKRYDSTGSWYVWDSSRGIVSGNDPYLLLNSTAAEVTNTDYIDTYSAGFEISSTAPAEINASGGSFIFFAVA